MIPTLSICIPTYERAHLLLPYLQEIDQPAFLPFPFEVIVVDNASSDPGYRQFDGFVPAHYHFSYFRRGENVGAFRNVLGSLRMARGEFCLYLGDDDRVIPSGLAACVSQMQSTPDLLALYSMYDEVDLVESRVTVHPAAYTPAIYTPDDASGMVEAFRDRRAMPEIGIYRTESLVSAFLPSKAIYFSHLLVERLLRLGSVGLSDISFYQYVRGCAAEPFPRRTLGWSLPLTSFDQIARGLSLVQRRFGGEERISRPLQGLDHDHFSWMVLAFEYAMANGRYIEACEMGMLVHDGLGYYFPGRTLADSGGLGDLVQCAACETIGLLVGDMPCIERVSLYNFDADSLSIFARVFFKMDISEAVLIDAFELNDSHDDSRLVVTLTNLDRRAILAAGKGRPGLVVSLEGLCAMLKPESV